MKLFISYAVMEPKTHIWCFSNIDFLADGIQDITGVRYIERRIAEQLGVSSDFVKIIGWQPFYEATERGAGK